MSGKITTPNNNKLDRLDFHSAGVYPSSAIINVVPNSNQTQDIVSLAINYQLMMEVTDAGFDAVLHSDQYIEDSLIVLGNSPGFGFAFDEDKLAAATVDSPSPDTGAIPWSRRQGAGLYEVPPGEET